MYAQHGGQELLSDQEFIAPHPVMGDEQPARKTDIGAMQPIASTWDEVFGEEARGAGCPLYSLERRRER